VRRFSFITNTESARKILWSIAAVFLFIIVIVIFFSLAPLNFPDGKTVSIKRTMFMSQAADELASKNIIKSPFLFKVYVVLLSGHRQVQAGDYLFEEPQSAMRVAYRMIHGIQDLPRIKVTFYEGMTTKDMAAVLKRNIPDFDEKTFLVLAKPLEGSLFPDTYFFYPNTKAQEVVDLLHETFVQKMKTVLLDIQAFGKPVEDVIKMASIVEKEATSSEDRRMIAGVLWRRISHNMALQVDPPFYYLFGKSSLELTMSDLRVDSPYNLYLHTGLTPTPINNPGLDAIIDTISPTPSKFLFFLSDKKGAIHYAETLDQHAANKNKYLK
jgi:UPF0755 protein